MNKFLIVLILIDSLLFFGCAVNDPDRNPFPATRTIIVDDIKNLNEIERKTVAATDRDNNAENYEGILLIDLLKIEGVKVGSELSGDAMTDIVIVEGADGYKVSFSLAELDPQFKGVNVILADTLDGEAIISESRLPRLVVPNETRRQARWVKDVAKIKIIHVE